MRAPHRACSMGRPVFSNGSRDQICGHICWDYFNLMSIWCISAEKQVAVIAMSIRMHFPITGLRTMARHLLSIHVWFQVLYFLNYSVVVPLGSNADIRVIGEVAEDVHLAGISAGMFLHLDEAVGLKHFRSPPLRTLVYYCVDKKESDGLYDITKIRHQSLCKKATKWRCNISILQISGSSAVFRPKIA